MALPRVAKTGYTQLKKPQIILPEKYQVLLRKIREKSCVQKLKAMPSVN
jgi:hypothetical protein